MMNSLVNWVNSKLERHEFDAFSLSLLIIGCIGLVGMFVFISLKSAST